MRSARAPCCGCRSLFWAARSIELNVGLAKKLYFSRLDVRFSIGYVLGFIFFLSPVIYPLEAIPKRFETLASLNPLSAPIELVRLGFLGDGEVHTAALLYSIGFAVLTCILGFRFFSKWEAGSIDSL